ncbi:hypothetical protein BD779DRAFT_1208011 [Infundibulicybe gibba]|nr:hypothetical protein BD779DRAFT_1208011 [Infundibulicybe gibba]
MPAGEASASSPDKSSAYAGLAWWGSACPALVRTATDDGSRGCCFIHHVWCVRERSEEAQDGLFSTSRPMKESRPRRLPEVTSDRGGLHTRHAIRRDFPSHRSTLLTKTLFFTGAHFDILKSPAIGKHCRPPGWGVDQREAEPPSSPMPSCENQSTFLRTISVTPEIISALSLKWPMFVVFGHVAG